jgi:uncharacterized protein YdcH (DUF465 family)
LFSWYEVATLEIRSFTKPSYFSIRNSMFPEYRELITKLKTTDRHFSHLFDKHNNLDAKILRMEDHKEPSTPEEIETLKKEKLLLKDQIYAVLKKAST